MKKSSQFLTTAECSGKGFMARFSSGATTTDWEVASFFMAMDDRHKTLAEVEDYIHIGRQIDPFKDWKEIQRIAATFTKRERRAAAGKDKEPE